VFAQHGADETHQAVTIGEDAENLMFRPHDT